jgi:serine protease Do
MKRIIACPLFLFLIIVMSVPAIPSSAEPVPAGSIDFVELAKQLKPAVVNISTTKTVRPRGPMPPGPRSPQHDFFEEFFERFFQGEPRVPRKERSLGSGFFITEDGFILTNDHVVRDADEVMIRLVDGRRFVATVRGLDPKLDLALLKIDVDEELPVARLGNSDGLQVGEWVMAIGNPFGLEQTVTVGIVSATGRVIGAGPYDDFIQTDASINPGNSGGPLFNMRGEVVGINTAIIAGGQGIGFATPINAAKAILTQLKEEGRVTRGWLGVAVQQMTEDLAASFGLEEARGALVSEVIKGSPAETAGFRRGDVILTFDGAEVTAVNDLPRIVAGTPVGKTVPVTVFRGGKILELTVTVSRLEEPDELGPRMPGEEPSPLGLTVSDITAEAMRYYNLERGQGALVTRVDPVGPAADAELRPGDIIIEVNGREIADAAGFRNVVGQAKKGQTLRLLVQRGDNLFYTTIRIK